MNSQQRKFYWAAVLPAACEGLGQVDQCTYDNEQMHERFKLMFLGKAVDLSTGEELATPRSTMTLTADETHDYFEAIKLHLQQFGIAFPDPDQHVAGNPKRYRRLGAA